MKAAKRKPARFRVGGYSAAFKTTVQWEVTVSESGIRARRSVDAREVSIDWRTLLGAALFYGSGSNEGQL